MSQPTTSIFLSGSTPAPSAGFQDVVFQSDGGSPQQKVSAQVPNTGGVAVKTADYTLAAADCGKLIVANSPSAITFTLPATIPFGQWQVRVANIGAGALSIAPGSLTLDGLTTSVSVAQFQSLSIATDATNYFSARGIGGANATQIRGVGVSATAPTSGQVLEYDATSGLYVPTTPDGGGGGGGWTPTVPSSPTSTGTAGQYSSDGTHGYLCYAANSWGRYPIAPAFENPPVTNGLVLYYDANMYGFTNGSPVNVITDLAGNGHDAAAQSTGATFETNQINGRAALAFPGSAIGNYVLSNGFFAPNITVFVVASIAGTPSDTASGGAGSFRLVFRPSGSGIVGNIQSDNVTDIGSSTAVIPLNTFFQMNVTLSGAGAWAFRTSQTGTGSGTSGGSMPTAASNLFGWSSVGSPPDYFNGKIAEFIVYNRALTSTEIASVEAFLQAKYGV